MAHDAAEKPIRAAVTQVAITVVLALIALVVAGYTADGTRTAFIVVAAAIMVLGSFAAMFRTWLVWRAGGRWQVWQGASWFLLSATILWVFTTIPVLIVD